MLTQAGIDVSDLNSLQSKLESGKLTAAGRDHQRRNDDFLDQNDAGIREDAD